MDIKTIQNHSDYEIREDGEIFSNKRKIRKQLKVTYVDAAYGLVSLDNKSCAVHRLVAEAFISNPDAKPLVNHRDGNKHNNLKTNLEWATHKENSQHACDTGLNPKQKGEINGMSKLSNVECKILIQCLLDGDSNEDLGTRFSLHPRYVSLIRGKKRWISLWDDNFRGLVPPKSNKPRLTRVNAKSKINTDTQITIIRRIHLGESLRNLADEYGLDPSSLSRVRSEQIWKFAHDKLKQINAQRLSKASNESK